MSKKLVIKKSIWNRIRTFFWFRIRLKPPKFFRIRMQHCLKGIRSRDFLSHLIDLARCNPCETRSFCFRIYLFDFRLKGQWHEIFDLRGLFTNQPHICP
jgi:hypothetical protein